MKILKSSKGGRVGVVGAIFVAIIFIILVFLALYFSDFSLFSKNNSEQSSKQQKNINEVIDNRGVNILVEENKISISKLDPVSNSSVQEITLTASVINSLKNNVLVKDDLEKVVFHLNYDINFDGYLDIGVLSRVEEIAGSLEGVDKNYFYKFYIWNPDTQSFEEGRLEEVANIEVNSKNKEVYSSFVVGARWQSYIYKYLEGGEYQRNDFEMPENSKNAESVS